MADNNKISDIFANMMEHSKLKMVENLLIEHNTIGDYFGYTATYQDLLTALERGQMIYLHNSTYDPNLIELQHMEMTTNPASCSVQFTNSRPYYTLTMRDWLIGGQTK